MKNNVNNQENQSNALNEICLSETVTLFGLAHSPLMPILRKMEQYQSFQQFLADASEATTIDYLPELDIINASRNTVPEQPNVTD